MGAAVTGIYGLSKEAGDLSSLLRGRGRAEVGRRESLHLTLQEWPVAAGQLVLVADPVRSAGELTRRQSYQSLPAELDHAVAIQDG